MFDPQKLLPIVRNSFPNGNDAQILDALTKLAQKNPQLTDMQALAALSKYVKSKPPTSLQSYLRRNGVR